MATSLWADPTLCAGCVRPQTWLYIAANLPYLIVPALMIGRMWKANPFGIRDGGDDRVVVDLRGPEPVVTVGDAPAGNVEVIR
jgi:hypothetical protein